MKIPRILKKHTQVELRNFIDEFENPRHGYGTGTQTAKKDL